MPRRAAHCGVLHAFSAAGTVFGLVYAAAAQSNVVRCLDALTVALFRASCRIVPFVEVPLAIVTFDQSVTLASIIVSSTCTLH